MQIDWWLQPRAVFGHTFSGIIWHMPQEWSQSNCMTLSWWPCHKIVSVHLHLHLRDVTSYLVMPRHAISCHVLSHPVTSCIVTSCHVMSHHVTSCHVIPRHVMPGHVMSRLATSCHVMSRYITLCHVMSRPAMSRRVTLCRVMSCHVMPRHVMSRPVMSWHVGCPEGCRFHTASAVYFNLVYWCYGYGILEKILNYVLCAYNIITTWADQLEINLSSRQNWKIDELLNK